MVNYPLFARAHTPSSFYVCFDDPINRKRLLYEAFFCPFLYKIEINGIFNVQILLNDSLIVKNFFHGFWVLFRLILNVL